MNLTSDCLKRHKRRRNLVVDTPAYRLVYLNMRAIRS